MSYKSKAGRMRPQVRLFRCCVCGAVTPATKVRARTKAGHEKDMWCYACQKETKHIQED